MMVGAVGSTAPTFYTIHKFFQFFTGSKGASDRKSQTTKITNPGTINTGLKYLLTDTLFLCNSGPEPIKKTYAR